MTFEQWWAEKGCRVECQTHEERARLAWEGCMDGIESELKDAWEQMSPTEKDDYIGIIPK